MTTVGIIFSLIGAFAFGSVVTYLVLVERVSMMDRKMKEFREDRDASERRLKEYKDQMEKANSRYQSTISWMRREIESKNGTISKLKSDLSVRKKKR